MCRSCYVARTEGCFRLKSKAQWGCLVLVFDLYPVDDGKIIAPVNYLVLSFLSREDITKTFCVLSDSV